MNKRAKNKNKIGSTEETKEKKEGMSEGVIEERRNYRDGANEIKNN